MPSDGPTPTEPTEVHVFTADRGDRGVRLDLVLLRRLRPRVAISRRRLQAAIEGGEVRVNDRPVMKCAARLAAGDRLEARLPAVRTRRRAGPQPLPLEILYEDEHLLAVNKAPGVVAHPSYKHADDTLFNALLWHVQTRAGDAAQLPHVPDLPDPPHLPDLPDLPHLPHPATPRLLTRLDKDTSGLVLVSKSKVAHVALVRDQRAGAIRKEYLALVRGIPKPASGRICQPLARDRADGRRVIETPEGKASTTRYETVASDRASHLSLVRCELVTGRMHQIRVHLASRGWPVLGDRVYGARVPPAVAHPGESNVPSPPAGQALHAWRVTLPHPITRVPLVIEAPVPAGPESPWILGRGLLSCGHKGRDGHERGRD